MAEITLVRRTRYSSPYVFVTPIDPRMVPTPGINTLAVFNNEGITGGRNAYDPDYLTPTNQVGTAQPQAQGGSNPVTHSDGGVLAALQATAVGNSLFASGGPLARVTSFFTSRFDGKGLLEIALVWFAWHSKKKPLWALGALAVVFFIEQGRN